MLLSQKLAAESNDPALTVGDVTLSYRELARAAATRAAELTAAGVRPAERLAVVTLPALDTAVTLVAHLVGDFVSVPINPAAGTSERAHVLRDAGVGDQGTSASGPDGAALILYTSGTSGPPKGAVITQENIAANLDALAAVWQWTSADRLVHALPLFHVHGLVLGLFGSLRVGGHLTWQPRFRPEETAAALAAGATMLFAVPTMYHRLADAADSDPGIRAALAGARLLVSGSAALPTREHDRLGVPIYERYGLTETLINCAVPASGPPRPGLVGPPLPGVELELRDEADGVGEIFVRGKNVFAGYLHRDGAITADGFFATGDLGQRTPHGLKILGRKNTDLIKTGGYKVGAGEVEACLLEHPAVAEVAVVGVPDPEWGEVITAYVVARTPVTAAALIERVSADLAPHKRPRAIHFVTELPKNALGKVLKKQLGARRS